MWRTRPFSPSVFCSPALSQTTASHLPPVAKTANLSGPRFGLTLLADGVVKKLEERDIKVGPHISQFGWQFEKQFYTQDSGVTMVTEWVALVGGLEQSVVAPQPELDGGGPDERWRRVRHRSKYHAGRNCAGPRDRDDVPRGRFERPVNVAVVPSKPGSRVSVLSGFSLRHR